MKKLILSIIIILITHNFTYAPGLHEIELEISEQISETYADFTTAYKHVRKWEGNYGWESGDVGGETYAGIARNYNKKWYGWKILDNIKRTRRIKKHDRIPELEFWATDYYLTVWLREGFNKLKNQRIATYLFDYRNSGTICYIHTMQILNEMNYDIILKTDVSVLNDVDVDEFIKKLQSKRMKYYVRAAKNNHYKIKWLEGWLNRVYDI